MTKEVGSDRVPYRRHYHRTVYADLLGGVAGGVATSGRPPHMDGDLQPPTPLHYHVDARFLPNALRGLMRPSIVGPIPRVFLTVLNAAWPTDLNVSVSVAALRAGRGGDSSWLRWLKRRVLSQWPAPHFLPRSQAPHLERQYADARVVNGRCPHLGFDLTTLPANADGHRVCPLHGLCWDGDGRLVPRAEQMEVMYTAAEAHEVRRRLREEPADPELRAWAVTQLAGRLQGPHAPLPAVDSRGLDEQDLVTEEDTAPVPPPKPRRRATEMRSQASTQGWRRSVTTCGGGRRCDHGR